MTDATLRAETDLVEAAPVGDIEGALGTVSAQDTGARRTWGRRLLTLAAIVGPGLIVMIGDNDAGGVSTYAQAGQQFGTTLLWSLLLLIPILIISQEMVVRLGAVTGVGHARLIRERFGRVWSWFSVGDLFFLNFLTIITEFIGVSLGLSYFGVPPTVSVPIAGAALVGFTLTGSFRRWERFMFVLVAISLLFIPLLVMTHPHGPVTILRHTFIPGVQGGVSSAAVLLLVAIVGTTVAPWQLFFQQSNVIDKRITPRWIRYERADTVIGAFATNIAAGGYICLVAFAVAGTAFAGKFTDAGGVAEALHHTVGYWAGALFAIILIDASIIGAACVTLSSAYAFGDTFNLSHSLHRKFTDAKGFYGAYAAQVAFAAAVVLIPGAPLGTLTEYVQVLAGVLLPSATLFLLLLCNDQGVLGPWVNRLWLNIVTGVIIAVLVVLSLILTVNALFPAIDVPTMTAVLFAAMGITLVVGGTGALVRRQRLRRVGLAVDPLAEVRDLDRRTWRMPPVALVSRPVTTRFRTFCLVTLRGYLIVAVIMLAVKLGQAIVR
ncbi:MAG TPA: NRAMP family divalent metal transporter [Acidimicrobiia bacterium]|jgi:Mn2+/Fe2+ NRAMP family transporter|nr:NRAMP family divalent metal transporter [Acidimicrobiia bacterium]